MKTYKYVLEGVVFVSGFVVMVFEIVGSRVLAPYLGTSISVWTSLIGIILGSLSLGYFFGGKISDKKPTLAKLSFIVFGAAVAVGLMILTKDYLLIFLQDNISGIRLNSVIASILLFLPTSFFLGMVSPYAVKLKINNLDSSGSVVGNLYAISTVGSIVGTFLAGFYLIPKFGTVKLLILLFIILVTLSLFVSLRRLIGLKLLIISLILSGYFAADVLNLNAKLDIINIDTGYHHVLIYNERDIVSGQIIKILKLGSETHSAMFLDNDELVYGYAKYYHLVKHFNPDFKKTLMIGGGAYSFPRDYLKKYPTATIDVVEIDPLITSIAQKYFRLKDDPRLTIYHQDGRVYLNQTKEKYDAIFGDAFNSYYSLPYQLTTQEAVKRKYDILNDRGVVIINIASAIDGEKGEFLRAEYRTYKSVFPQVYLFPVEGLSLGQSLQNVMLVALKSVEKPVFVSKDQETNRLLQHLLKKELDLDLPILTDDFAPVDYYINKINKI